jgi:hypothetical protein
MSWNVEDLKYEEINLELKKVTSQNRLQIGGKLYELNPVEDPDYNSIIEKEKEALKNWAQTQVNEQINLLNLKVSKAIREYEIKMENILNYPSYLNDNTFLRHKILSYRIGTHIKILKSSMYQPIKIKYSGKFYKVKEKISKRVFIEIEINRWEEVESIRLLRRKSFARFKHYHSLSDRDCTGNLHLPKITSITDLLNFFNRIEEGLKLINVDDLAISCPAGLPHYGTLIGEEIQEGDGVWITD